MKSFIVLFASFWLIGGQSCAAETRPNIVYILADDLGYGDVRAYNPQSKIPTPNLDRLASQGIRFTDAHAPSAVCTPTRYGLLTGRYAFRSRLESGVLAPWGETLIEDGRLTVPALLRQHGYATTCIGKWHLGWNWPTKDGQPPSSKDGIGNVDFTKPIPGGPTTRGFDTYFGVDLPNYPPYCFIENDRTVGIPSIVSPQTKGGFNRPGPMVAGWNLTNIMPEITTRAVRYIEDAAKSPARPFFLYFPLSAPHYPVVPSPEFKGRSQAGDYGDFVAQVDWTVGEVMSALARTGLATNALVIFTSDNGPEVGEVENGAYDRITRHGHRSMDGLRGVKRDAWEGGHRVPFIARWPNRVPAGGVSEETICHVDLMATCAALLTAKLPLDAGEDSYNILPALLGQKRPTPIREATVLHSAKGSLAIRQADWVLIDARTGDGNREPDWFKRERGYETNPFAGELYNLRDDLSQSRNLYGGKPEIVQGLKALLEKYKTEGRSAPLVAIAADSPTAIPEVRPLLIAPAELALRLERGRDVFTRNCFVCHQFNGQGIPGVFPPLAKSDWLTGNLERAVKAVLQGLAGEIVVNGKKYNGAMPTMLLNDEEVADVFTYVLNNWGNAGGAIAAAQVKDVRSRSGLPTFEKLQQASAYAPLPSPPEGFTLRELVRLPVRGVRLTSDGEGRVLYVLTADGDVFRVETETGQIRQILWPKAYLVTRGKDVGGLTFTTVGMAMDQEKRLYIAGNQQDISQPPVQNHVTIYRTTAFSDGDPVEPKPWFWTNYPGSRAYIHAAEHIAFGPDGFLYVGNGARTDAGQTGTGSTWYGGGETPITACIWRLDPKLENPPIEVFARGIRNAYGFCWNDKGEMIATENGPDADPEEELNLIERGKHYGFPYTFAKWKTKAYRHTPDAPSGLEFTPPIPNVGPDGGFNGKPIYSFDPHSCPGGIAYLGNDFPEGYRDTLLLTRFGNFIRSVKDSAGFDVLKAKLRRTVEGKYEAEVHTFLAPLGRPLDVHVSGKGKVYILEYSRPTDRTGSYALPGRILELSGKAKGS